MLHRLHPQSFEPGEPIYTEGLPGDRVYVVVAGIVKVTRLGPGGRKNLVALAGPGDIVGELALFDPGPRTSSVVAVGPVETGWLDRNTLRRWIANRPVAAQLLLQLLARQIKRRQDQFAQQRPCAVVARVARQLLDLTIRFGATGTDGMLALPHLSNAELADLVGASEKTVTAVLRDFIAGNVIRAEGDIIVIRDHGALERAVH